MNGEVNGTMEKPSDDSIPNLSHHLQNEKKVASDECCDNETNLSENSNNTEASNHLDGENSQECSTNSNTENLINDNSNGSEIQEHDIQLSPKVSENENSNSIILVDNCGNSNESYPESVNSSQAKSDKIDESKSGEPSRLFAKATTSISRITEVINDENNCGNSNESCTESVNSSQPKSDSTGQPMIHIIDVRTVKEPSRLFTKGLTSITRITQINKDESNCGNNSNDSYAESIASSKPDSPEQPLMHIMDVKSIGEPPRLYHKGSTSITRISQFIQDESIYGNNSNESHAEYIASSQSKPNSPEQPLMHIVDVKSIGEPPRLYHKGSTSITRISQFIHDEGNSGNNSNESHAEYIASSQSKPNSPEQPLMHIVDVKSIGEPPRLYHKGSTSITRISQIIDDESNSGNNSNESHAEYIASSQSKPNSPEQPLMHIVDVKSIGEPPRLYHKGSTSITRISQIIHDESNSGNNSNESHAEYIASSQSTPNSPEQPLVHILDVKSIGEPPRLYHKGSTSITRISQIIQDESNCGNNRNESHAESIASSQAKPDSPEQPLMHIVDVKSIGEPSRLSQKTSTSVTRISQIIQDESNGGNNSNESLAESIASSQAKPDSPEQPLMHIVDVKSIGEPPRLYHKGSTSITRISQFIHDESIYGNNSNESHAEYIASSQSKPNSPEQPLMHIVDVKSIGEPPRLYHKGSTSITRISQIIHDEGNSGNNSNESHAEYIASSQSKPNSPEQPLMHIVDVKSIGEPPRLYHKGSTSITRISQIIQDESNSGNNRNESHAEYIASSQAKPDSPEQPLMHIVDIKSIGEPPRLYHKGSTSITRIAQTNKDKNNGNSSESYTECMNSSQTKSDSPEQPLMHIVDVKSIGEPPRLRHKSMTRIIEIIKDENSETDSEDTSSSAQDIFIGPPRPEDTVSINSDDTDLEGAEDLSQEGMIKISNSNIIMLENEGSLSQNGNSNESPSPDIQEITSDNDDCVMADENVVIHEEKEKENTNDSDKKVQLRRSSRAIKRKRYNDDIENGDQESDLEEVAMDTSFHRKNKPIVINDTKALVEMAARQMKSNQSHSHKKEPTVVIIDTNSLGTGKSTFPHKPSGLTISSSLSAQSLYQSIVARGTTVTPVSSKSNVATQSCTQVSGQSSSQAAHSAQPLILPSLTDDMFVVEAPSFIVPYVYEKPSVKPFREFVDLMGKELDEQKAKEEKEKDKKEKEKQEKKEKGDDVEESEDEASPASPPSASNETRTSEPGEEKKKKKKDKRRRGDEDDASWDGETSTDSEDEILMSDDENKTIIIKDKVDSMGEIKDVTDLTADKVCSNKTDNYFDCSIGKFFINIGLSLVQEYVQTDLLKQQNRKLNREKKTGHNTKSTETSIASLMKNIEFSKQNNIPYSFTQTKCEFCSFKTESKLAMAHHLETPHMKNNVYKCNFCPFEIRSPHDILYHMEAEHNIRGKLERAPAYHQCANCPFEDNGKGKLARHLIPCAKKFKPELNLAPPLEWEPPAKIPKIARSRNNMMTSYHNSFNRSHLGSNPGRAAMNVPSIMPGVSSSYRPRNRTPIAVSARAVPIQGAPILRGGVIVRHNTPVILSSNYPVANNAKKTVHQPSISITPLPRQPQPVQPVQPIPVQPMPVQPQPSNNSKNTFVICEICDGYIKDLEQLRNHMQWIHKVKIHPKMIYNRPPLNCQKCQFRFFTDQGLERHLLGSHGLVTSSMQEAANKGKDAGRCPVCGRVYQWKLLNHVARDHNMTLKPAHLSYKCTVCTATFGMYKQFLSHVYSAHSVVAKRVMDKSKGSAPKTNSDSLLKPLKINDEITIIPQPVKSAPAPATAPADDID